jgi:hypothetical protein
MKKYIIRSIILLIFALAFYGTWQLFFRQHRSVTDEKAMEISAVNLFNAYSTDESNANKLYLDKALIVSGTVLETKMNRENKQVVILKTDDPIFGVVCAIKDPVAGLAAGNEVRIKGFCSGYTTDVVLRDCILIKQ